MMTQDCFFLYCFFAAAASVVLGNSVFSRFPLLPSPLHPVTVTDDDVVYSCFPLLFLTALSLAFLAPAVARVYY